ncbi:transcription factor SFP1 [Entomortierella parvispora]|uniref:Transcription factor SFP1 n=1 Tax=Entomortierella parvispora TaxID=205924 RepID=A0A9P3HKQ0_9FUNG|nr:transcription factor SFP1 [Entomortierella parvispora]
MPAAVPTPCINISAPAQHNRLAVTAACDTSGSANSSISGSLTGSFSGSLSAPSALRRPSLVHSFHSAQLRRPSFFAPFPYSQSPQHSDLGQSVLLDAYSSSPRHGDVYERELEADYCKNFSCCGLTLNDLHALLQHYEEAHVRFEGDENDDDDLMVGGFTDDDDWSTNSEGSAPNSPQMGGGRQMSFYTSSSAAATASAAATVAALAAAAAAKASNSSTNANHGNASLLKKKSTGVSLSDIYSEDSKYSIPDKEAVSAFSTSVLRSTAGAQAKDTPNMNSKKRDLSAFSTSFDSQSPLFKKPSVPPQSAYQKADLREDLLNSVSGYLDSMLPKDVSTATHISDPTAEDLIRKREEIVSMMESIGKSGTSGADKPYRCHVSGCDKAYKNPNGLKYHNQHGHCSMPGVTEEDKTNAKPYRCSFLDCGKCYKNLNGLKYHIEHSHPNLAAALHSNNIPDLAALEGTNASPAALAAAAAIATVRSDPVMMCAVNAIMASAANKMFSTTDHTPDSSPNSSPSFGPTTTSMGRATYSENPFSTDVTPMTSPVMSRAILPGNLSIQTSTMSINGSTLKLTGLMTPSSLSPTLGGPKSPNGAHVSTLTAALAAVTVEHERLQQLQ